LQDLRGGHLEGRRLIWRVSAEMARTHGLLGGGLGSFYYDYIPAQGRVFAALPPCRYLPVKEMVLWAHDEWLQEVLETGLPGALLLTLLFGAALGWGASGKSGPLGRALAPPLAAWVFASFFDFPLHRPMESFLAFALLGLIAGSRPGRPSTWTARRLPALLCLLGLAAWAGELQRARSLRALRTGLEAMAAERLESAGISLERAVEFALRPGYALANLAGLRASRGDLAEARVLQRRAEETFRDTSLYRNMARLEERAGDTAAAEEAWNLCLAGGLDYVRATCALARLEARRGATEEALRRLDAGLACLPKNRRLRMTKARLLARSGRSTEALRTLREPAPMRHPQAGVLQARLLERMDRPLEALRVLDGVLARRSGHLPALRLRMRLYQRLNRPDRAAEAARAVLRLRPDDPEARAVLSGFHRGMPPPTDTSPRSGR